ncbi:hypothetical protein BLOT_004281 [Blomia tropicalis]|nr:hypothetical protein BLOT_004281 [Blomia tropicalis]
MKIQIMGTNHLEEGQFFHLIPLTKDDSDFECPKPSGRFGRESDCRTFYSCVSNQARVALCPPMTQYDDRLKTCYITNYVECYQKEQFVCPEKNGNFRNNKCDRYFICKNGKSYMRKCPVTTLYDIKLKRCANYFWANCNEIDNQNIPDNQDNQVVKKNPKNETIFQNEK